MDWCKPYTCNARILHLAENFGLIPTTRSNDYRQSTVSRPYALNSFSQNQSGSTSNINNSAERKQKRKNARKRVNNETGGVPEELESNLTQDRHIDLTSLVDAKNLKSLEDMGGINGLLGSLSVDPARGSGVDPEEPTHGWANIFKYRQKVYGAIVLVRKCKSLLELVWLALKDEFLESYWSFCLVNPSLMSAPY